MKLSDERKKLGLTVTEIKLSHPAELLYRNIMLTIFLELVNNLVIQ
jgi:hypothetical protein